MFIHTYIYIYIYIYICIHIYIYIYTWPPNQNHALNSWWNLDPRAMTRKKHRNKASYIHNTVLLYGQKTNPPGYWRWWVCVLCVLCVLCVVVLFPVVEGPWVVYHRAKAMAQTFSPASYRDPEDFWVFLVAEEGKTHQHPHGHGHGHGHGVFISYRDPEEGKNLINILQRPILLLWRWFDLFINMWFGSLLKRKSGDINMWLFVEGRT